MSDVKDWDKWLLFLLHAYREVPQASTGFSPFELLYEWQEQDPLELVKRSWEAASTADKVEINDVRFLTDERPPGKSGARNKRRRIWRMPSSTKTCSTTSGPDAEKTNLVKR